MKVKPASTPALRVTLTADEVYQLRRVCTGFLDLSSLDPACEVVAQRFLDLTLVYDRGPT
jgi:hypothetical protein